MAPKREDPDRVYPHPETPTGRPRRPDALGVYPEEGLTGFDQEEGRIEEILVRAPSGTLSLSVRPPTGSNPTVKAIPTSTDLGLTTPSQEKPVSAREKSDWPEREVRSP